MKYSNAGHTGHQIRIRKREPDDRVKLPTWTRTDKLPTWKGWGV